MQSISSTTKFKVLRAFDTQTTPVPGEHASFLEITPRQDGVTIDCCGCKLPSVTSQSSRINNSGRPNLNSNLNLECKRHPEENAMRNTPAWMTREWHQCVSRYPQGNLTRFSASLNLARLREDCLKPHAIGYYPPIGNTAGAGISKAGRLRCLRRRTMASPTGHGTKHCHGDRVASNGLWAESV